MKILMVWGLLLLLLVGGTMMQAELPENAQGKLTVNGKTTELRYAYARERQDLYDPKVREVRVVLSDAPIADADMEDDFAVHELGVQGKIHAVDVRFSLKGEPQGGSLHHDAAGPAAVTWTGEDHFASKEFSDKTVAGKLWVEKPIAVGGFTIDYTATFSAPVQHESKPTAEGAAAAASGPGKVLLAYMQAARAHDMPALKKFCTDASYQQLETVPADQFKPMAAEMMPPDTQVVRVFESGDHARVETHASNGAAKWKLVRINNEWKVQL